MTCPHRPWEPRGSADSTGYLLLPPPEQRGHDLAPINGRLLVATIPLHNVVRRTAQKYKANSAKEITISKSRYQVRQKKKCSFFFCRSVPRLFFFCVLLLYSSSVIRNETFALSTPFFTFFFVVPQGFFVRGVYRGETVLFFIFFFFFIIIDQPFQLRLPPPLPNGSSIVMGAHWNTQNTSKYITIHHNTRVL